MLNRANPQHAGLADLAARLVPVVGAELAAPQDDQTVVAEVVEVRHEHVDGLLFAALKERILLLTELGDDLREEVHGVDLVLRVCIHAADDLNDLFERLRLRQQLEEGLILAELGQDLARVERHVHVVRILGREHVDERVDHHGALLLEHGLHALLIGRQLIISLL